MPVCVEVITMDGTNGDIPKIILDIDDCHETYQQKKIELAKRLFPNLFVVQAHDRTLLAAFDFDALSNYPNLKDKIVAAFYEGYEQYHVDLDGLTTEDDEFEEIEYEEGTE